ASGALLDSTSARRDGAAACGRAVRGSRRRVGAIAPELLRRGAQAWRRPRGGALARSVPLCVVRGGALSLAAARATAGVEQLRGRRLQQVLRDEGARSGAEAWAGPCARADVPQALDRRCVTRAARERPPEKVLVERERAAVWVTLPKVHVQPLEIGGREDGAG